MEVPLRFVVRPSPRPAKHRENDAQLRPGLEIGEPFEKGGRDVGEPPGRDLEPELEAVAPAGLVGGGPSEGL